jgi:hypothetical protein
MLVKKKKEKKRTEDDDDWQYYYHGFLTAWQHTCKRDADSKMFFYYPRAYHVLDASVAEVSKA